MRDMSAVATSVIHITGASGCGVTTLGRALAGALGSVHIDADDFFWVPTDPPYIQKRDRTVRVEILGEQIRASEERGCVLSGSILDWGDSFIPLFHLVVFLSVPAAIRLQRLKAREAARFGARIQPGGDLYKTHLAFLEWADGYDDGNGDGRTRERHEKWLAQIGARVLRLDGTIPSEELVQYVLRRIQTIA